LNPPFTIILYCSHPHSWNSFDRSHFSIFIHEHIIFPLYSPSYTFCLQPPPTPCTRAYPHAGTVLHSYSLFLKKRYFCLYKIAIQRVLLWNFHVCMYYNPPILLLNLKHHLYF
jgi:hypothetical protein